MGLKKLLTDLKGGLKAYPNHNTPSTSGCFNYGGSSSVFDSKQFNQRSLKHDQGRASEHQQNPTPSIVTDLPGVEDERSHVGPLSGLFNNPIGNFIDGVSDGFVRGGLQFAARRSLEDTKRIGKFFLSANGLGFVANQVALQRTNPIIQETAGDGLIGKIGSFLEGAIGTDLGVGNINRTYNPLNTLAQIPISVTGKHLDRAGLLPFRPEKGKYQYVVKNSGNSGKGTSAYDAKGNRLLFLGQQTGMFKLMADADSDGIPDFLDPDSAGDLPLIGPANKPSPLVKIGSFVTKAKDAISGGMNKIKSALGLPSSADLPPVLYEYPGGPGSLYGVGDTTIRRYTDTKSAIDPFTGQLKRIPALIQYTNSYLKDKGGKPAYIKNKLNPTKASKSAIPPYQGDHSVGLSKADLTKPRSFGDMNSDYRHAYISKFQNIKHTTGKHIRREQRFQTGDPGASFNFWRDGAIDVNTKNDITIDKINALDILKTGDGTNNSLDHSDIKDMVRFHIEAINTDNPLQAETMVFRAFLDDWSDDYTGNWNAMKYNGRGEEFYTYDGFKRTTSFSFKIAAQTRYELKPLYRKLNYLVSQTAPDYKNMRMRGNFVKISIGDLMDRTPGIITSVGLKWQKDYPWEIAIEGGDTEMLQLPHCLDVSVKFTPIHSFVPQKGKRDANGNLKELSPFILPSSINGSEHIVANTGKDWTKTGAADNFNQATPGGESMVTTEGTEVKDGTEKAIKPELDPTGKTQGVDNIPKTTDSQKSADNVSTTTTTTSQNIPSGDPRLESVPGESREDRLKRLRDSSPGDDASGNPTGDVDTSSAVAAEKVKETDANASNPLPENGSDWDDFPHTNNQPDPRFPGGVTWNQWFGKTREQPKGHYANPPPIYKTDYKTCGTSLDHMQMSGTPPIARAKVMWGTGKDATENWIYACGSEQEDPKYGHLYVEWLYEVEGEVNNDPSEFLINAFVISKGALFTENVELGNVIQGSTDFGDEYESFNQNTRIQGSEIRINQPDWAGGRAAFAEKLLQIAEELGAQQWGPDYKIERR